MYNKEKNVYVLQSMRLAFADTRYYVADPLKVHVPISELLSKEYAAKRRSLLSPERAQINVEKGIKFIIK